MPYNNESINKYEQDPESNEHFYQNHSTSGHANKKKNKKAKASPGTNHSHQLQPVQSNTNLSQIGFTTSSTASSNRELLGKTNNEKSNYSYVILFIAVLCELASFITIVITFIFPFWALFSINTNSAFSSLSISNQNSLVTLLVSNTNSNSINFNMGIWEVKMNTLNVTLLDQPSNIQTTNSNSMLWLNTDSTYPSFLASYLNFIQVTSANIFTIQILEIIHLIFTFLTFCATSITLCLCSKKRTTFCWYLVCYFLCLTAFLTGLAVIIIIIVWQTSSLPSLVGSQAFSMSKMFTWCFWAAIGANASLLLASLLILIYVIVGSVIKYNKKKNTYVQKQNKKKSKTKTNEGVSASILKTQPTNKNQPHNDSTVEYSNNMSRIPRLQAGMSSLSSSPALVSNSNQTAFHNLQSIANNQNNPSYTFYTGYGNYHKQNIRMSTIDDDSSLVDTSFPNVIGYPIMKQANMSQNQNVDHAYSNVFDQINQDQTGFKYQSYH